ncbi:unnamed protein product [Caenorhabditis angaria]|uniref:Peptidase M1 leukotriene A4 hydrolase/aminopeptidase C-terminal domain-containing protein n=1 Tax=Caenorhabditis angaria TaxID=860376 RepID=A0A9P1IRV4_9PELO|nr:unnamed protein product [Caenorhabditis angaria]
MTFQRSLFIVIIHFAFVNGNSDHPIDPSTGSNYRDVTVEHLDLRWKIDFERTKIIGEVDLHLKVLNDAKFVMLDVRDLSIRSVTSQNVSFHFQTIDNGNLGQKLKIYSYRLITGDKLKLTIKYETSKNARALQFLTAEQTEDGKNPYLFSQCGPINARSIVPCMDTPSVASTYTAQVYVPPQLTCLMSAISLGSHYSDVGNYRIYSFEQNIAIPSYLLAIVVGKLEQRHISYRSSVWSEPSQVSAAQYEFDEIENILQMAEDIAGPYIWGRYDIIVLPSSFPFSAMENPCLTFVSPTLITGNRSLVSTIVHEIAHSWTGNLVRIVSWEQFWMKEGFTNYLQQKINGRLYGEKMRQFAFQQAYENRIVSIVNGMGKQNEFTKLNIRLGKTDPVDAFSPIPYDKGAALILTIEQTINDDKRFDKFLKNYIKRFSYKSVSSSEFIMFLYQQFPDKIEDLNKMNIDLWINQAGLPPKPHFDTTVLDECKRFARIWVFGRIPTDEEYFMNMTSAQKVAVIDEILIHKRYFSHWRMAEFTKLYNLSNTSDSSVRLGWIRLGLSVRYYPIIEPSLEFISHVGILWYNSSIYRGLFNWNLARNRAISNFYKTMRKMNPMTIKLVNKLIR